MSLRRNIEDGMHRVTCFHRTTKELQHGGIELLGDTAHDADRVLWLNIDGTLDDATAELLETRFGLHPLALQDASRDRHPPKLEAFDHYTFLIYKGLAADADDIDCATTQIIAFVGEHFLVTRHAGPSPSIERLRDEIEHDVDLIGQGPAGLAIRLSRLIVDRYLRVLLALEPELERYERALLGEGAERILSDLIAHKADLVRLQRIFHYQEDVTSRLAQEDLPGFDDEDRHGCNDVHEQQLRVKSLCDLYYRLCADLIEGYISVTSHRLNQIMRVLTIVTVVFVPLSFLAGIYGMNFENMPELGSRWGYFMLLGVMVSVATGLLLTFRRKRWL